MLQRNEYALTESSVDQISQKTVEFLMASRLDKETVTRNRLFVEELLIGWKKEQVSDLVWVSMGTRFGKPCIVLECDGLPCNVFEKQDEESGILTRNLLRSLGRYPAYSYRNGRNIIQMTFQPEKKNKLVGIGIAIFCAVLLGILAKMLLKQELCQMVLSSVVDPLYSAAFRLLGFISGPLILLSVMWGIYGIGDATALSQVGKKMILHFLTVIFIIAFAAGMSFPLFHFSMQTGGESSSSFKAVFEMILDVIPPNIVEPFSSGNTLHLIFCAVIFGIAMLYLGKRVSTVADLVEEINGIVQFIMSFISNLMPGFVFLVVLRIVLNGTLSVFSSVWKLFLIFVGAVVVMSSVFTAVTSIRFHVSPFTILKKSVPTFLIAITTASSAAAFSSNMETCEKKFGIDGSLCAFGIPLGMVMFKTATTMYYVIVSFFFAGHFGVSISPEWVVSAAFVSAMLAIATPPIPGGGVAAYTMLFARLGIPDDALAIVLSMDILFDFIRTATNMYNLPLGLISVSSSMGKLNRDILRK